MKTRKCDITSIVKSPWGVAAPYKEDIINGSFGALDRALKAIKEKEFYSIEDIAAEINVSVPTAWYHVKKAELKYIVQKRKCLFYYEDVAKLVDDYAKSNEKEPK